ncbi:MAG: hypothetical protein ACLGHQ_15600 [Acidimicrobiia bacterium]
MSRHPLSVEGGFGVFADSLLGVELPDLPEDRRRETVAFVCRRAHEVPTPLRLGVATLSLLTGTAQRVVGVDRTTAFLRATTLPFVGELARMVRSLGLAFVWETWPTTTPTGAPEGATA